MHIQVQLWVVQKLRLRLLKVKNLLLFVTLGGFTHYSGSHPTFSESFGFLAKQMMGEVMVKNFKILLCKHYLK